MKSAIFLKILKVAVEGHVENLLVILFDFIKLFFKLGIFFVLYDDIDIFPSWRRENELGKTHSIVNINL